MPAGIQPVEPEQFGIVVTEQANDAAIGLEAENFVETCACQLFDDCTPVEPGAGTGPVPDPDFVDVRVVDQDDYGRLIGTVYLEDNTTLNARLVGDGYAWWNRKYAPRNDKLKALEEQARKQKKGLWKDPQPIPPWKWRRINKTVVK